MASLQSEVLRKMKPKLLGHMILAAGLLAGSAAAADNNQSNLPRTDAAIAGSVQHNLLAYSYFGIFDDLSFQVQNGRVTLNGAVTEPFKKSDVENIVAKVPGVQGVTDKIQVLPFSDKDNQLRSRVAAMIHNDPSLAHYVMAKNPSIHILVNNGHVTLMGAVETQADKDAAGLRAEAAGLTSSSIVNNLQLVSQPRT
jgi:hyperosmotically inducible periplasmic protein